MLYVRAQNTDFSYDVDETTFDMNGILASKICIISPSPILSHH